MLAQQRKLETSFGFTLTETSRLVEQRVRLAQHRFAAGVLANYRWQCGFCGFAPGDGLRGYRLLIASQVKPWARSNNRERSDVTNGVCACPMHDSAFDAGLLRLKPEMEIVRAKALESRLMKMNRWRAPSARPCCASRCLYLKLPSSRAISSSSTTKRSCFVGFPAESRLSRTTHTVVGDSGLSRLSQSNPRWVWCLRRRLPRRRDHMAESLAGC